MLGSEAAEKEGTCLGISLDLLCVSTYHIDQHSTDNNLVFSDFSVLQWLFYLGCNSFPVYARDIPDRETKVESAGMLLLC